MIISSRVIPRSAFEVVGDEPGLRLPVEGNNINYVICDVITKKLFSCIHTTALKFHIQDNQSRTVTQVSVLHQLGDQILRRELTFTEIQEYGI